MIRIRRWRTGTWGRCGGSSRVPRVVVGGSGCCSTSRRRRGLHASRTHEEEAIEAEDVLSQADEALVMG